MLKKPETVPLKAMPYLTIISATADLIFTNCLVLFNCPGIYLNNSTIVRKCVNVFRQSLLRINHPSNTRTKNEYKDDPIFQTYNNDLFLHIGHPLICVDSSYNQDLLKRYF
jgi:hypothetical protein